MKRWIIDVLEGHEKEAQELAVEYSKMKKADRENLLYSTGMNYLLRSKKLDQVVSLIEYGIGEKLDYNDLMRAAKGDYPKTKVVIEVY